MAFFHAACVADNPITVILNSFQDPCFSGIDLSEILDGGTMGAEMNSA
jgi:hypothetical protein